MSRTAWGAGLATVAADGSTLDVWYRWLGWGEYGDDTMAAAHPELDAELERARELQAGMPAEESIQLPPRDTTKIDKDEQKRADELEQGRQLADG